MVNVLENALQALPDRSRAVLVRSFLDGASDAEGPGSRYWCAMKA
jgi:DNA-directed RNA polymerase specialized sigma24 family protein